MTMADPALSSWTMTCCGTPIEWLNPPPSKTLPQWPGNDGYRVDRCPNEYCLTNVPKGKTNE